MFRINQNHLTVEYKTQMNVGLRSSMPRAAAVAPFEGVALGVPRDRKSLFYSASTFMFLHSNQFQSSFKSINIFYSLYNLGKASIQFYNI
jgi:hypothetical protein